MIYIGCHLSVSDGFRAMGDRIRDLGGDTFAFFTRNPRGGSGKSWEQEDLEGLISLENEGRIGKLVAHAPYTMNICSDKEKTREFAELCFSEDLGKMERLPGNYFNFHPGNFLKQDREQCMERIADVLSRYMKPDQTTTVLLETMAGKGTELGRTFRELSEIINYVNPAVRNRLGVCLDTCHVWDGGYDIAGDLDGVLDEFQGIIGLDRLKAVHLNDSLNDLGAHKDRHARLGEGKIGLETLKAVVTHPALQDKPFILETPNDMDGYRREIALVRQWMV